MNLKIILMNEIVKSDLNKNEKLLHLETIKNYDITQYMGFLLDNKIYKMNDKGKKSIKERFFNETMLSEIGETIKLKILKKMYNYSKKRLVKKMVELRKILKNTNKDSSKYKTIKSQFKNYKNQLKHIRRNYFQNKNKQISNINISKLTGGDKSLALQRALALASVQKTKNLMGFPDQVVY